MEDITKIIYDLRQVNGLANFNLLSDKDRFSIIALEDSRNIGVLESVKRQHTLLLTHNSSFRDPVCPIVTNGMFPPIPFPEVNAKSVVSSSPGIKVHNYLVNKFKMNLSHEDATLLVGFDL